jgi:hypothetical protein
MNAITIFILIRRGLLLAAGGVVVAAGVINAKKAKKAANIVKADVNKMAEESANDEAIDIDPETLKSEPKPQVKPMTRRAYIKCFGKTWWGYMKEDWDDISDKCIRILSSHNFYVIGAIFGIFMRDRQLKDELEATKKKLNLVKDTKDYVADIAAYAAQKTENGKKLGYGDGIEIVRGARDLHVGVIDAYRINNETKSASSNTTFIGSVPAIN